MKKFLFIYVFFFLISAVFGLSNINGRNSFFIESGTTERKKLDHSLFFNAHHNEDEIKVKLEYDDNKEEDNGIINLNLEYKEHLKYGFYYEKNIFYYNSSRYHGLSYINKDHHLTVGWLSGLREIERHILNGRKNIFLKRQSIIENTETIIINSRKLKKNEDYYIDYYSGIISIIALFPEQSLLECSYSYRDNTKKQESYISFSHTSKIFDYKIIEDIHRANIRSGHFQVEYVYDIEDSDSFDSIISYKDNNILLKFFPEYDENGSLKDITGQHPKMTFKAEHISFDLFDTYEICYLNIDPIFDIGVLTGDETSVFSQIKGRKGIFYFDSYFLKEKQKGITADSLISLRLRKDLRFFQKDIYFRGDPVDREKNLVFFTKDFLLTAGFTNGSSSLKYSQKKGIIKKAFTIYSHKDPTFEASYRDKKYSSILTYDKELFIRNSIKIKDIIFSYEKRMTVEDIFRIDIRSDLLRLSYSYSKDNKEDTSILIPIKEDTINIEYDAINNTGKYSYIVNIR